MTMKAIPPPLGKQGGEDAITTKAALPSLNQRRGFYVTMTMAIPPSLGEQGGSDAAMTLALGEVGGFHAMTTTDLGDRGKFDATTAMAVPPSLGK